MKKITYFTIFVLMLVLLAGCGHKHAAVIDAAVPATCNETGLSEGTHCSECGETIKEQVVIEALGHNIVSDPSVPPTCSTFGLTEGSHCSLCDAVMEEQKQIDKLNHTVEIDAAISATTTSTGLTEGSHCSVCNTVIVEQETTPMVVNYTAPYCAGDFSKIGETFSTFYVAGSGLQYSSNSLYILMVQEYPLIRNGWDAYTDYNGYGSRVGVANDRIVFNVQDLDSVSVAEALPADMLEIEPLIVCGTDDYGNIGELMLIWKGDNGYMVGFTTAYGYPNNSYQNEQVKFFISTVDLAYISNMPAEVISANPAY